MAALYTPMYGTAHSRVTTKQQMSEAEIKESDVIFQAILTLINSLQEAQILGNAQLYVRPHEPPGVKFNNLVVSSRTGYGFNLYCDYFLKGNAGKRMVIIDKDFNAKEPGFSAFDHIPYDDYLKALNYIIQYLHKKFDANKVHAKWVAKMQQVQKSLHQKPN